MNSISIISLLLPSLLISTMAACGIALQQDNMRHISNPAGLSTQSDERQADKATTIRVMTINLAHGRGTSFHQLLLGGNKIKENLDSIVGLISREQPHVVAIQEADGSSIWNGSFNHVEYLLNGSALDNSLQGFHVRGLGLEYGTAILSDFELTNINSYRLQRGVLTLPKGFVVSTIEWPYKPDLKIDIVSVHLDFLSDKTRIKQARKMLEILKNRNRPMIIMGDFNTDWNANDIVLKNLTKELNLKVYQPDNNELITFSYSKRRFDWILISDLFEFTSMEILADEVSDHRAVVAEIRLRAQGKNPDPE